jgi:single-stranded DNA-binding protein
MYMNQLTIIGFTGQDAELHYTQNGTPVTTLSVANYKIGLNPGIF